MTVAVTPPLAEPYNSPLQAQTPACIMSFNANDPTGAGGLAADIASISAMGAHTLPIVTAILMRDTAEIFEHTPLDAEVIDEQARNILEDVNITAWKVGFLGSAEGISAVAEVLSDYPDTPLVTYLPNLSWLDDEQQQSYTDALRELILPQTDLLIGSHRALTDFLLPEWPGERAASARELAVAASEHGSTFTLVTSMALPDQFLDNVLANDQGIMTSEKFERFEAAFVGAGDTLSACITALLGSGTELHTAISEALSFLDQALDSGFRPGMGNVIADRFFWATPDESQDDADLSPEVDTDNQPPTDPRHVH
jgi:hydroxymethylpyrimidine/phosphomethylpyrimidine kinase